MNSVEIELNFNDGYHKALLQKYEDNSPCIVI